MSRRIILLGSLALSSAFILSGCEPKQTAEKVENAIASISIPFEWFKKGSEEVAQTEIPEIKGLNLAEEVVDLEEITSFSRQLNKIGEQLAIQNDFLEIVNGERSLFNLLGSDYFDFMTYDETEDGLNETLMDIGKVPHQWVHSLSLRQYGVKLTTDGKPQRYAIVDVNAVNDTEDFRIQTLQMTINEKGRIQSSRKIGEPSNMPYTVTPLSTEDSFLSADTHREFLGELEKVIQNLSNPSIYSQIELDQITTAKDPSIKALTKQLALESQNEGTVFELLKRGKGVFEHWGITGYLFDDKNLNALTYYELSVADEEGIHCFTVHYHRGTKKITHITQGSPFEEVMEE